MNELEKAYMTMQDACDIEVGDTVKVLRKADNRSLGWIGVWNNLMNIHIGKDGVVKEVSEYGFQVEINSDSWNYPFFVLEKIPKPHWRDTVSPENPVLCYVRDEEAEDWRLPTAVVQYDVSADINFCYRTGYSRYAYAKRVPKSMIESMLKAYDETSEDE